MYPDHSTRPQAGAGLPIALFIITVLSLIVLGMSQLQESSSRSVSLQIQSQRAFFAAESGAQVALTRLFNGLSCPAVINFDESGLGGCSADITGCTTPSAVTENGTPIYTIQSTGVCGPAGGTDSARRKIEVMVR